MLLSTTTIETFFKDVPGGPTSGRLKHVHDLIQTLPAADRRRLRLEVCGKTFDRWRFGQAKKRFGKCRRIGEGLRDGRNYQVWAVWS